MKHKGIKFQQNIRKTPWYHIMFIVKFNTNALQQSHKSPGKSTNEVADVTLLNGVRLHILNPDVICSIKIHVLNFYNLLRWNTLPF